MCCCWHPASYTLDPRSSLPLRVDNGTNSTLILYGQAAIGEYAVQTTEWRYYLGDAQLSVRQLVDGSGSVTQAQTYAPFGILLHQAGSGGGLFGYKGGQSSTNGLWYFGNGYFDPNTGQFISQNGDAASPLAAANAIGFFLAPVLFIGWRGRKGKKRIHPATLLFLGILLAATLSSCANDGGGGAVTVTPVPPPEGTGVPTQPPATEEPPTTGGAPILPTPIPTTDPDPIEPTPTCPIPEPTGTSSLELDFMFSNDPDNKASHSMRLYNSYVRDVGELTFEKIVAIAYANEFADVSNISIPDIILKEAMARNLYQVFKQVSFRDLPLSQSIPAGYSCKSNLDCERRSEVMMTWLSGIQGWYGKENISLLTEKYNSNPAAYDDIARSIISPTDFDWTLGISSYATSPWIWGNQPDRFDTNTVREQFNQKGLGVAPNAPCTAASGYYYVAEANSPLYPWFVVMTSNQSTYPHIGTDESGKVDAAVCK